MKEDYDEIVSEKTYADMNSDNKLSSADKLADVSYIYWKEGKFVLCITFSAANTMTVPFSLLDRDQKPSELDAFLYRSMNNVQRVDITNWIDIQRALDKGNGS